MGLAILVFYVFFGLMWILSGIALWVLFIVGYSSLKLILLKILAGWFLYWFFSMDIREKRDHYGSSLQSTTACWDAELEKVEALRELVTRYQDVLEFYADDQSERGLIAKDILAGKAIAKLGLEVEESNLHETAWGGTAHLESMTIWRNDYISYQERCCKLKEEPKPFWNPQWKEHNNEMMKKEWEIWQAQNK